jgi:hypothetical protein
MVEVVINVTNFGLEFIILARMEMSFKGWSFVL